MKKVKLTLTKKILIIFWLSTLIPILLLSFLFYENINRIMKEKAQDSLSYSVETVKEHIDNLMLDTEEIAVSIGVNEAIQAALQREYDSYDSFYKVYNSPTLNFIKAIAATTQGIEQIGVYTDNPTIYNSSIIMHMSENPALESWIKERQPGDENLQVSTDAKYEDGIEPKGSVRPRIHSFYRIIPSDAEYSYEMAVCIEMNMEQIYEWMAEDEEGRVYYLINEQNQIVASSNKICEPASMTELAYFDQNMFEDQELLYTATFGGSMKGWQLAGVADEQLVVKEVNKLTRVFSAVIICVLLLAAGVFYFLIRPYTDRLKLLSKRMQHFSTEDLSPIVTRSYHDEVEIVIDNYNQMMQEMDTLINEVYALNMQKKELELNQVRIQMDQLLSQVNPHFMFNTLNAILEICEIHQYTEVSWVIEHLAVMMRRLLDWSDDMVSVKEELDFVRMHLEIEKLRFREQFDFALEIDDCVLQRKIPKMSIQPLVENACKHGIHKNYGYGKVIVRVYGVEHKLMAEVLDTGKKLTEEQIAAIRQFDTGVGLKSVYHRLKIYYGERAALEIKTVDGYNCFGFWIDVEGEQDEENIIGG